MNGPLQISTATTVEVEGSTYEVHLRLIKEQVLTYRPTTHSRRRLVTIVNFELIITFPDGKTRKYLYSPREKAHVVKKRLKSWLTKFRIQNSHIAALIIFVLKIQKKLEGGGNESKS